MIINDEVERLGAEESRTYDPRGGTESVHPRTTYAVVVQKRFSTGAHELASPKRSNSLPRWLASVWRPALVCDLLIVVLLASWAASRLDLIVNHGLVGGNGDESHRLVISYRLCHDFSRNIYSYFFHSTWPPLPYIIQGAAFHLQQGLGLSSDFGTVAICSSTCAYALAVALAYAALAVRFQRIAGLIAVILMLSLHQLTDLAITPMAESYCTLFLAWALLLAALPGGSRRRAVLVGLAIMLATQCRSETIVLSVVFAAYCFFQDGRLAGAVCLSIAAFPFLLKVIVNRATGIRA